MNGLQKRWLDKASMRSGELSDWENKFIQSILRMGVDYVLSDKQNSILNRINDKLTRF